MYDAKVMYPYKDGSSFNLDHYFNVHMKLGLGHLWRNSQVRPKRVSVNINPLTPTGEPPPYHCIANMEFRSRDEIDALIAVLNDPSIFRELASDFPKYCPYPPEVIVSEIVEVDPETMERIEAR